MDFSSGLGLVKSLIFYVNNIDERMSEKYYIN